MLTKDKELKLYYSIKEVAQLLGVNESTLRYWEKEFPQLRPKTQALKVRGFKLAAARKMLVENRKGVDKSSEVLETLLSVRSQLQELKRHLSGIV